MSADQRLAVGKLSGAFGVRGWVKVYSLTDPVENILNYSPWNVFFQGQWRQMKVVNGRVHGKGVVAQLEGVDDRNAAELLNGAPIEVSRDQIPEPGEDEFYWEDLQGLAVENLQGVTLGTVSHLFETQAHPILVLETDEGERMIPFVETYVVEVLPEEGKILVDWQADW